MFIESLTRYSRFVSQGHYGARAVALLGFVVSEAVDSGPNPLAFLIVAPALPSRSV